MFLRWTKYRDKRGRVACTRGSFQAGARAAEFATRAMARYVSASSRGRLVRGPSRQTWAHLDYVLARYRLSATERENIERAFAPKPANDPPPTALENLWTKLARKMHRLGRISCKVLIFRGIKFATQISAAFAEPHRP